MCNAVGFGSVWHKVLTGLRMAGVPHIAKSSMPRGRISVEALRRLALAKGYRLDDRDGGYWLIGLGDQLPLVNEPRCSLYFTAEEAQKALASMRPVPVGAAARRAKR
jgi:hypothetical protein